MTQFAEASTAPTALCARRSMPAPAFQASWPDKALNRMPFVEEHGYCENCGTDAVFLPAFSPEHGVKRCGSCAGWSYVGPLDVAATDLYGQSYFAGGEYADYDATLPAQRRNFERKLRLLARAGVTVGKNSRVLEIGCATGAFLAVLREAGVTRHVGVEVSDYARDRARSDGLTVLSPDDGDLPHALRDLQPNLIVGWDVWEHLDKPATLIDGYLRVADPNLALALTTVDASSGVAKVRGARWRQFHPPTHLHYPTRASFRRYCSARSLRVALHRSFGYYRPALEYLRALRLERIAARLGPMRTFPVYLNLWDTQLVVARRSK